MEEFAPEDYFQGEETPMQCASTPAWEREVRASMEARLEELTASRRTIRRLRCRLAFLQTLFAILTLTFLHFGKRYFF